MTTVLDSRVFSHIFSTAEVAAVWSDERRTEHFLQFEVALARAQARLNIIPPRACDQIVQCARLEEIDFDQLRRQTEWIGYPVLPVVRQLVAKINAVEQGLGEWVHWGTTTQDLTDTAVVLQLRETIALVETEVERIVAALRQLCREHRSTPMAARSNLQQAVPISLGFKMARLLATFQRHQQRLQELKPRLLVLQFSGAAGTLATIGPATAYGTPPPSAIPLAVRCQRLVAQELRLAVPDIAWHTERDRFAEFANCLALLTATCAKFATDLKLMMQTEVAEAREPYIAHRGSSSTMPQKRNPIGCAYIGSMASSVRAMSGSMVEAMVADHERSTGPWEIEWIVLPQICALSHACLRQTGFLLEGLEVDATGMAKNLALSKGAVVSEAVMMGLGRTIGRQFAHDLVYDLCHRAQQEDRSLLELMKESEEIKKAGLSDEQLERLCDPANYLGLSEVMVDSVLNPHHSASMNS